MINYSTKHPIRYFYHIVRSMQCSFPSLKKAKFNHTHTSPYFFCTEKSKSCHDKWCILGRGRWKIWVNGCRSLLNLQYSAENKVRAETALATPVTNSTCLSGEFTCSSGLCLSPEAVCDFSNDCGDRSDEVHCRHRQTKCWSWQSPCLKDGRCQSSHFQACV